MIRGACARRLKGFGREVVRYGESPSQKNRGKRTDKSYLVGAQRGVRHHVPGITREQTVTTNEESQVVVRGSEVSKSMVFYDLVQDAEIETVWEIERQGFPPDEADSLETLKFHQRVAPELFLGAFIPLISADAAGDGVTSPQSPNTLSGPKDRRLIAYTFSTLSPYPRYTQQFMTAHVPHSRTICSHTLCVDKEFRGASVGLGLFVEFVRLCRDRGLYDRMVFMAKRDLLPVYEKLGFTTVGKAEVVLGKEEWYEMKVDFTQGSDLNQPTYPEKLEIRVLMVPRTAD